MTSPLMEYLGIAGLDIAWLFIGIFVVLLILLILIIVQFAKYKKLKKKYDKFMKGKDGKSLEKDIIALFEDNKFIKSESEKGHPQYPEKTGILLSEGWTGKIRCL